MNQDELLATLVQQLRDPDAPASAIQQWPPAPGWWILAAILLFGPPLFGWLWKKRRARALPYEEALQILERAYSQWQQDGQTSAWLQHTARVIREIALHSQGDDGKEQVGQLQGQAWHDWLVRQFPGTDKRLLAALSIELYRAEPVVDVEDLHPLAKLLVQDFRQMPHA